jgi:hypothetical protein
MPGKRLGMPERLALRVAADRQGTDRCRARSAEIARGASTELSPSVAKHQVPRQAAQVTGGPIPVGRSRHGERHRVTMTPSSDYGQFGPIGLTHLE